MMIPSFPESAEYVTKISAFFLLGCDMITLEREGSEWCGNFSDHISFAINSFWI